MQVRQKMDLAHVFHRKSTSTWVVLEDTKRTSQRETQDLPMLIFRVKLKGSSRLF